MISNQDAVGLYENEKQYMLINNSPVTILVPHLRVNSTLSFNSIFTILYNIISHHETFQLEKSFTDNIEKKDLIKDIKKIFDKKPIDFINKYKTFKKIENSNECFCMSTKVIRDKTILRDAL